MSVLKRFGTEGALNWIRLRSRAATKRKNQGCGFAPEDNEKDEEPVTDEDIGSQEQSSSTELSLTDEASLMALQDFVVCRPGPLTDAELKQVWSVLQRRKLKSKQKKNGSPNAGDDAPVASELEADWISSEEKEEIEVPEHEEISLLVRFLRTNKTLQKFPGVSLQWLATRLQPQEEADEAVEAVSSQKLAAAAASFKLAAFRRDGRESAIRDSLPSPPSPMSPKLSTAAPRFGSSIASFSSKVLQQARELGEVAIEESKWQSGGSASLRVFIHGDAQWKGFNRNLLPGDLMIDMTNFMPSWYNWIPQTKNPQMGSSMLVATVDLDQEFVEKFGAPFQCAGDRAAAFHATSKLPGIRSISDVSMIVRYLRRMDAFASFTPETLEAIACALQVRSVQQNDVLSFEGQVPSEVFLPLSTTITAWRRLPEGLLEKGELRFEKRLSSDAVVGARTALALAGPSREDEKEAKEKKNGQEIPICVDIIPRDKLVRHSEWALAGGKKCSVSLVVHCAGKGFSLSKSDYERHVQQHRSELAPLEVFAFLARNFSHEVLSHRDHSWLEETPLARCATLRALPQKVRINILSKGRLQRLPTHSWLSQEDDMFESGLMIVQGQLEYSPQDEDRKDRRTSNSLLPFGSVIGDFIFSDREVERGWASQYRAAEECYLIEVPKEVFQSEVEEYQENAEKVRSDQSQLLDLEEALQMPSSARSFQQLQLISSVLEKQPLYGALDSYVRLEVCQWATLRLLGFDEDVLLDSQRSCYLLQGELSVRAGLGDQQIEIFTAPAGVFLGEESGMSGDLTLHPVEEARLLWLDKTLLPHQLQGKLTVQTDNKGVDKASLDRNRAIQTLKFKAPEQRSSEDITLLVNLMRRNNKFFTEQEDSVLREICRAMSYMEMSKHSVIMKQGDVADMCYVMLRGSAGVWVRPTDPKESRHDETQSPAKSHQIEDEARETEHKDPSGPSDEAQSAAKRFQKAAGKLLTKAVLSRNFQESPGDDSGMASDALESEEDEFAVDPSTGGLSNATKVKEIHVGACFGETGLLYGARRNASIIAAEHCQLGAISKALFERELRTAYLAREQKRVNFLREYLPRTSATEGAAQALGGFFTEYQARRGHVICVAGKACERLMIIRDGLCKVRVRQDGLLQDVGEIGKGQWIGLTTLGGFEVEPFTVVCTSEVVLLRMDATDARTRMSSELREAVVNVGAQMHCRMQRRADLLRTAFDSMAEAAVKSLEPPKEMPKTWATWAIDPKLRPRGAPEDRRQLQRLLEQQREWEDLATSNTLQWSPTLISDKQKEKERLTRLVHARNIKTDRLLRENATWQHEKHLALTRPDLQERTSCRKTSGMISCGLFIPGKVQSSVATESMSTSKFRPKRQGRLNSVWFPSAPPHEVLRPVSRSFQAEEDATQIASNLKRTMAVPISPPLRPPDLADETDAVLWCSPMQAQEPSRFGICPVEPTLPNRPKTTPTTSRQGQLGHLGHLGHPGLEGDQKDQKEKEQNDPKDQTEKSRFSRSCCAGKASPVQRSGEMPKDAESCRFKSFNPSVVFHEKLFSENQPLQNLSIQAAPRIKDRALSP